MKTLKNTAVLSAMAFLSILTAACKSAPSELQARQPQTVTSSDTLSIDEILARPDSLAGQEIVFEGVCTHICAHGGQKIFLMGSDDSRMLRVEASKGLGSFKKESVNSLVAVRGTIVEDRIDEAYLLRWEEQVKAARKKEDGHDTEGCAVEQQARGESAAVTVQARIDNYRRKIAERKEKEGKDYLSFYHAEAAKYDIK